MDIRARARGPSRQEKRRDTAKEIDVRSWQAETVAYEQETVRGGTQSGDNQGTLPIWEM